MSKSNMSMGRPSVVQAFGICCAFNTLADVASNQRHQKAVENEGEGERKTHINQPSQMPLHRRTTQQQINLIIIIPESFQVFDTPQRRLSIRDRRIHVMLFAVLIYTKPFKIDVAAWTKLGLHGSGDVDGRF